MNQNKTLHPHIQKLIDDCHEAMVEAINEECNDSGPEDATSASTSVITNDGKIDLWMDKSGNTEVAVYHDNDSENECLRLCVAIEEGLPDWEETVEQWIKDNPYEDEWTLHGFRDEADYLRWRYS